MLRIRLQRPGKSVKGKRHYKIVVIERGRARDAGFKAELGYYNPAEKLLKVDIDKYDAWFKKGAQPTETVASLYKKYKKIDKK
ncbi:MAG: 30S ribosomal protein S16 [Candidatus Omnitrophica bacterium]|nr:30S ribosomal protein S16 [Candidatus Omnitrophota bacterium]